MRDLFYKVLAAGLIFVNIPVSYNPAYAQDALLGGIDLRSQMASRIKDITESQFIPNLTQNKPEYLNEFRKIKVVIVDNARPTARSKYENGDRIIEINTGVIFLALLYNEYSLLRNFYAEHINDRCKNYMEFLGEKIKTMSILDKPDYQDDSVTAGKFCGAEKIRTPEYAKNYLNLLDTDRSLSAVIGFVLGHEYGHHLLKHLPPKQMEPAQYRQIEIEADNFGSNILGNFASRASATLIFDFLEKQRRADPFAVERRYPAEECRFIYLMNEDTRFWRGHQGAELQAYLDQKIELKERIPRIFEYIDAKKNGKTFASKCDGVSKNSVDKLHDVKSKNDVSLSQCWNENNRLEKLYAETYLSIDEINKTIPDKQIRKAASCPKFRQIAKTLKDMINLESKCTLPEKEKGNIARNTELIAFFNKIVSQCDK